MKMKRAAFFVTARADVLIANPCLKSETWCTRVFRRGLRGANSVVFDMRSDRSTVRVEFSGGSFVGVPGG